MIHGCVTLDEVFAAASVRAASLVPETSGYLALAVGDATSRLPFAIDERNVMLTTEGNVGITRRGEVLPPPAAAAGLRDILARLLAVSTGTTMPALAAAGRPRDESDRGVEAVVGEIEAALIPVNRAAARRALARLARETIKAKEAGKVKPRPSNRPPAAPKPEAKAIVEAAPAPKVEVEAKAPVAPAPKVEVEAKAIVEQTPAPRVEVRAVVEHAVTQATTPPPVDPAPRAPAPLPVAVVAAAPPSALSQPFIILPTPPPVPAVWTPSPAPAEIEPTPTVLGMGPVEMDHAPTEIDAPVALRTPTPAPALSTPTPQPIAATPAPQPIVATPAPQPIAAAPEEPASAAPDLAEPADAPAPPASPSPIDRVVLAQPTEPADVAFGLEDRARPQEPLTPPFALDVEPAPRALPAARPMFAEARHRGPVHHAPNVHTRADDLLAHFGASCNDDAHMREAASCLRRMAGIEATPPPARAEPSAPPPVAEPARQVAAPVEPEDLTPAYVRPRPRRGRSLPSLAVTLAVLVAGLAGGGALVRLRPDLFGVSRPGAPAVPPRVDPPAAPAPVITAEPRGAQAPAWQPSGAARAERAAVERAR